MEYIIDRFENDFVICEDEYRKKVELKRADIPNDAKEGDVLKLIDEEFIIDSEQTQKRRDENFSLLNKLLGK